MSMSDWVKTNIVQPVIDELLKPENLATITEALAAELATQGDRIIAEVTGHSAATAATVINDISAGTEAARRSLSGDITNVGQTVIAEVNAVISTLFENIKNLFPHIPGFGEPPPRPRGRR